MKKNYSFFPQNWRRMGLFTAFAVSSLSLQAQTAPAKLWDKTIGGSGLENLSTVKQTTDGGYIMGGISDSGISGDKSQASKGGADYWIVKTDATGTKTWDKTIGGGTGESFRTLQQTADGGYIIGGYSESGLSGDKSQASKGTWDYWIVKLDATGTKVWDKTLGGSGEEKLFAVQQTADGGYILAGVSTSGINGDKSQASQGGTDYWVVKLDATGTKVWDKTFGGSGADDLYAIHQTTDGGYILGGASTSGVSGDKTQASKGLSDFWVVKLDGTGTKVWDKTLGGSSDETVLFSIQQTVDGGYILGGSSTSGISGDKTEAIRGLADFWVVKLDGTGTKTWDKTLGGSAADNLRSLQQTLDGGYILGGTTASGISGDKTEAIKGSTDYWVVKLDATGAKTWDKTLGGSGAESFNFLRQTTDGGFVLGGHSDTGINGDKSQASKGGLDYWMVRLAAPASTQPNDVAVSALTSVNSGCALSNQETITITVNNLGTAPQSNIPVSYKINNGTAVNEVVPGPVAPNTSASYSFVAKANLSTLGTYAIETRTSLTGDALTANDIFTKTITTVATPGAPTVAAGGATALCPGSTAVLTATSSATGATYQWFLNGTAISGAMSATYTANAAGSYTATVNTNSCTSPASTPLAITTATAPAIPTVTAGGPTTICSGSSVTLTAASTTTGATYSWLKNGSTLAGATGATYVANAAGTYTVIAIAGGCNSNASSATTVTVKTTPATPTVTQAGFVLSSSGTTGNQWYKNGAIISGATSRNYTATTSGAYTVVVTTNGCSSLASNAANITISGLADEANGLDIKVYPNPSAGLFSIEMPQGKAHTITVTDLSGKVVQQLAATDKNVQVNLRDAAKGIYLLKVTSEGKTTMRKLVVE